MATKNYKLSEIANFSKKSHRKAGDGLSYGIYPFFTSSQTQGKWLNEADYKEESIILGTGGLPSVHIAQKFSTSADTFILTSSNSLILIKYVYYFLSGNIKLLEKGFKGAGLKHLSKEYLKKIVVPVPVDKNGKPDLGEQNRIILLLEEAQGVKQKRFEANNKTEVLVLALFEKMFGECSLWDKNHEMVPLKDLVKFVSGGTPSKQNKKYWNGNIPWVSAKDMKMDLIESSIDHITETATTETNVKFIEPNSVLIVVRGMILAKYVPISLAAKRLTINQDLKALVPTNKISGIFLWIVLRSISYKLEELVRTAAHGTKKLDTEDLLKLKIPVPNIVLQNKFAEQVMEIQEYRKKQKESTEKVEELFDAVMAKSFA